MSNLIHVFNEVIEKGGATYDLMSGKLNTDSGYMVALPGYETIIQLGSTLTLDKFRNYVIFYLGDKELCVLLGEEETYLGFWLHDGKLYIDIAKRLLDRNEAILLGRANGQHSIYDLNEKKDIEVHLGKKVSNDPDLNF